MGKNRRHRYRFSYRKYYYLAFLVFVLSLGIGFSFTRGDSVYSGMFNVFSTQHIVYVKDETARDYVVSHFSESGRTTSNVLVKP